MALFLNNGRIVDPESGFDSVASLRIDNGVVAAIGDIFPYSADEVIDCTGCVILPGFVDLHVHFREPGREDVETIAGGVRSALAGGFSTVVMMPNTIPAIDSVEMIRFVKKKSEDLPVEVLIAPGVTIGRAGVDLTNIQEMIAEGAVAFTDDGSPINDGTIMEKALRQAKQCNVPIMAHEEVLSLSAGGSIHDGSVSRKLNVKGFPREAEEQMVERDILLAEKTGGHLHIQHLSSGLSVDLVRSAKARGVHVTAESAPHYFSLTHDAVLSYGSNAKMNPPLKEESDRRAVIEGLRDGTIDAIATDHAPHSAADKAKGLEKAPFGIIGLETALPLIVTKLIREEGFSYIQAFSKVTCNPSKIIEIDRGRITVGCRADITVIDPESFSVVSANEIISHCKNSPFIGMNLYGKVCMVISKGNVVHRK